MIEANSKGRRERFLTYKQQIRSVRAYLINKEPQANHSHSKLRQKHLQAIVEDGKVFTHLPIQSSRPEASVESLFKSTRSEKLLDNKQTPKRNLNRLHNLPTTGRSRETNASKMKSYSAVALTNLSLSSKNKRHRRIIKITTDSPQPKSPTNKDSVSVNKKMKLFNIQKRDMSLKPLNNHNLFKKLGQSQRFHNTKIQLLYKSITSKSEIEEAALFFQDIAGMVGIFDALFSDYLCINRHWSENCSSLLGKLVFFIGLEIYFNSVQKISHDQQKINIQFQIYICLKLRLHKLGLQCLMSGSRVSVKFGNYQVGQKYAEKSLIMAVFYQDSFYEDAAVEQLSLIQYYMGNISESVYLHENVGRIKADSLQKIKNSYQEKQQLDWLERYLFNSNRGSIFKQNLVNNLFVESNSYQQFVVFETKRVPSDQFYQQQSHKMLLEAIQMERNRQMKQGGQIIKKCIRRQATSYKVTDTRKRSSSYQGFFKYQRFNRGNEESCQILKTHLSPNRSNRDTLILGRIAQRSKKQFLAFLQAMIRLKKNI